MFFAHELALLTLAVVPLAVVVALNLVLAATGERDTLLLPAP